MTDTERINWLEKMVDEGACPAVLNDDNGHWAVSFEGFQNCPESYGPGDIDTVFFVEAKCWKDTIREAIDAAMNDEENE